MSSATERKKAFSMFIYINYLLNEPVTFAGRRLGGGRRVILVMGASASATSDVGCRRGRRALRRGSLPVTGQRRQQGIGVLTDRRGTSTSSGSRVKSRCSRVITFVGNVVFLSHPTARGRRGRGR